MNRRGFWGSAIGGVLAVFGCKSVSAKSETIRNVTIRVGIQPSTVTFQSDLFHGWYDKISKYHIMYYQEVISWANECKATVGGRFNTRHPDGTLRGESEKSPAELFAMCAAECPLRIDYSLLSKCPDIAASRPDFHESGHPLDMMHLILSQYSMHLTKRGDSYAITPYERLVFRVSPEYNMQNCSDCVEHKVE